MSTGKPDFNLNSYGVKYLSKEEVQEFLEKRQGEDIGVKSEPQTVTASQQKPVSKRPTRDIDPKTGFGSTDIKTEPEPRAKPTAETTSVFNSPTYGAKQVNLKWKHQRKNILEVL